MLDEFRVQGRARCPAEARAKVQSQQDLDQKGYFEDIGLKLGALKQNSIALASCWHPRHGMEASPTQHATQPEPKELEKGVAELVVKLLKTLRGINSLGLALHMSSSAHDHT